MVVEKALNIPFEMKDKRNKGCNPAICVCKKVMVYSIFAKAFLLPNHPDNVIDVLV